MVHDNKCCRFQRHRLITYDVLFFFFVHFGFVFARYFHFFVCLDCNFLLLDHQIIVLCVCVCVCVFVKTDLDSSFQLSTSALALLFTFNLYFRAQSYQQNKNTVSFNLIDFLLEQREKTTKNTQFDVFLCNR